MDPRVNRERTVQGRAGSFTATGRLRSGQATGIPVVSASAVAVATLRRVDVLVQFVVVIRLTVVLPIDEVCYR